MLAFCLLKQRRLLPDFGKVSVRFEQGHSPSPADHGNLCIWIFGDIPFDFFDRVTRPDLKALAFTPRIPDQAGQKSARIIIAQGGTIAQCAINNGLPIGKFSAVWGKQMPMHPRSGDPRQPRFKVLEKVAESFENRVLRTGQAVFAALNGKAALHIKAGSPARATLDRFGEYTVDFAGVWLGPFHGPRTISQESIIKTVGKRPYFARDKTIRSAQQLQMVIVENMRLALIVEFRQR